MEKTTILRRVLGDFRQTGTERLFHCPNCKHHKNKLSVNIDKDKFQCWHCGYSGKKIYRLIRRFGSFTSQQDWREITLDVDLSVFERFFDSEGREELEQIVDLPKEYIFLGNKRLPMHSLPARHYLAHRGITMDEILFWKIGYCPWGEYKERIIIPSFNSGGDPNYFISRTYKKHWAKYKNPNVSKDIIFNELYLDFKQEIVLVEGVFDAIVAGENAVPILGSTLRENSKLFQSIVQNDTAVYFALDPDADEKAYKIMQKLLQYDVDVYKVDITGFADVGEMTMGQFIERKKQATWVNPDSLLAMQVACI
tara:strand:- start:427 stop:1356 length:930 start_codon:yes stop_codon:yes gene_type:complete